MVSSRALATAVVVAVCGAVAAGQQVLAELPLTAADFCMNTIGNTTYAILQRQVSYYQFGAEFWKSVGGGSYTVTAASAGA